MAESADSRRPTRDPWNIGFGVVVLAAALLSLFVWFPNDIKGGFIDLNQVGKPEPGDAFFPILLAVLMLALGAGQLVFSVFGRKPQAPSGRLTPENLRFLLGSYGIVAAGLAIMYWVGPLVVETLGALGATEHSYRQLTDTAPYKYLGYVTGGLLMTLGLIVRVEGLVRPRAVLAVAVVLALLIVILDVLLYNIQLPPNADY
jgi:hypothetical protein